MGNIREVLYKKEVPSSLLNKRITVELCENVHLHYRNLRLEFSKEEFVLILNKLKSIDEKEINDFEFGDDKFKALVNDFDLPTKTEYDDRLQIEEQLEGHYHIHYRNLRIEVNDLRELGYWDIPKQIGMDHIYYRDILSKQKIKGMEIQDRKIGDLLVTVYNGLETSDVKNVPISESPCLKFLNGDIEGYQDYIDLVKKRKYLKIGVEDNTHSAEKFNRLVKSLDNRGYSNCFLVVFGNLIGDGQHRAAWLYNKFGDDKTIKVISVDV